jgi:hypothetical protein
MKGIDVVAGISIVCLSGLIYLGHDGMIMSLLATIIGYYFGRKSITKEDAEESST